MRKNIGNLRKMRTVYENPVKYSLVLGTDEVPMNEYIGSLIQLKYDGIIHCKVCGKKINKVFGEGFCYPDFLNHPENSECIIRPELCEGHLGKGRDPEWELAHHVQPHVVYLAVASGIKVGVTRRDQVPVRWMDQGAWKAVRLAETPNRYTAGLIEVALKDHISDKTHWQKMLKNELATDVDVLGEKARVQTLIPADLQQYLSDDDEITEINYPAVVFPSKIKSISLDKTSLLEGKLVGIKGQYLIFENGEVLNVRKHTGYFVELNLG
ncbi:MAG: DUF2797 domain-containing protein [Bacteroidia bacterium]|nr:DUF2797 domain-containing protein [Bacteroidia bacterium]